MLLQLTAGDVAFVRFPQEETDRYDSRPCVVLAAGDDYIWGLKVTSTQKNAPWSYPLSRGNADTEAGYIRCNSYVILRRLEKIPHGNIFTVWAKLKPEIIKEICDKVNAIRRDVAGIDDDALFDFSSATTTPEQWNELRETLRSAR